MNMLRFSLANVLLLFSFAFTLSSTHGGAANLPSLEALDKLSNTAIQIPPRHGNVKGARATAINDGKNLVTLANGDFLYRFGLEDAHGIEYWAYNGDTREVIAAVPASTRLRGVDDALEVFVSLTEMPNRLTCGDNGRSHVAFLTIMQRDNLDKLEKYDPKNTGALYSGIVRNDIEGIEPVQIYNLFDGSKR